MSCKIYCILIILILIFNGCGNPPLHTNPVDPLCPWADITMEGKIYSLRGQGIADAHIDFLSSGVSVYADDSGYYYIDSILSFVDTLIVSSDGYKNDTVFMSFNPGDKINKNFLLFAIPVIDSQNVYSYHLVYSAPSEENGIICDVYVTDKDRIIDIETVNLNYGVNTSKMNVYKVIDDCTALYRLDITNENSDISVFDMVGLNFIPIVEDYENIVTTGEGGYLVRVIEDVPDIIYPEEGGYLYYGDTIKWRLDKPSFSSFVNIYIMNNDSIVWEKKGISIEDTFCVFDKILPSKTYNLRIAMEDEYGDWGAKQIWFVSE